MTGLSFLVAEAVRHPVVATAIAAILALLSSGVTGALQAIGRFLCSIFVVTQDCNDEDVFDSISLYLFKHSRFKWGIGTNQYLAYYDHVKSAGENRVIFKKLPLKGKMLYVLGLIPIFCTPAEAGKKDEPAKMATVRYLRGSLAFHTLLTKVGRFADSVMQDKIKSFEESYGSRFEIIRHAGQRKKDNSPQKDESGPRVAPRKHRFNPRTVAISSASHFDECVNYRNDDLGVSKVDDVLEQLSITEEMQRVAKDVKIWLARREWYSSRGIDWRRGVLLYGRPGTGKTTLIRALAEDLDLPVHVFDLSTMDNQELAFHWAMTKDSGPRIVLLEDFDSVFHGRDNVIKDSTLTFDALLNVVAGIEKEDGLLLMVTTNCIEHIDPALGTIGADGRSTRPGRIDLVVELKGLDHAGRVKVALRILRDPDIAESLAAEGAEDTAAQFTERCIQVALQSL